MRTAVWTLAAFTVGCDHSTELVDVGMACVTSDGTIDPWGEDEDEDLVELNDGDQAIVVVMLTDCESGSFGFEDFSCAVQADGSTLAVTSYALRIDPRGGQTDDCNIISTTCTSPALAEGSWTVTYGEGSTSFDVPYSGETLCADGAEYP